MRSVYPYRSSERVLFREKFRNVITVHANKGTLVGSPTIKNGIKLNGTTQYITYPISDDTLARDPITFVIEFIPDFDYDDSLNHYLVDSTNGARYFIYKNSGNNLSVRAGNVTVANIIPATYLPHWRDREFNRIVVSFTSGASNAWLNGAQILTNDTTVFELAYPTTLNIGSDFNTTGKFVGEIRSVSIHDCEFDQNDVSAIQDGSLYTYANRAQLWADMSLATIDGSNNRTLDRSRFDQTILLGNGTGTGTPSFSAPGFLFDGVDDFMTLPADPTGTYTVVTKRGEDLEPVFESDLTTWTKIKTPGQLSGTLEFLGRWPFSLSPIQRTDLGYRLRGIR